MVFEANVLLFTDYMFTPVVSHTQFLARPSTRMRITTVDDDL